jgi:hypothetical protein
MNGEVGWVEDGSWFGSSQFEDPAERTLRSSSWGRYVDPIGTLLSDLDHGLINRLVAGDPRTGELIDGYRWRGAVRRAPAVGQRVVLAMRCETVAVGCQGLPIGLFERFSRASHLPPVATGCARWALSEEGPFVKSSVS